jgi:integrase
MPKLKLVENQGKKSTISSKDQKVKNRSSQGGRVYSRGQTLWLDFYYLDERVRVSTGQKDTHVNREQARRWLNLIQAQIQNGIFCFGKHFPTHMQAKHFALLEGRVHRSRPQDVLFGLYAESWMERVGPTMKPGLRRSYWGRLRNHILPHFGLRTFAEITRVSVKEFVGKLMLTPTRQGDLLKSKTITEMMIPLRVIYHDAVNEHEWVTLVDPFMGLKLPRIEKHDPHPFEIWEWKAFLNIIPTFYRQWFEVAVLTGLRPSEQLALKWEDIDLSRNEIYIRHSLLGGVERNTLKTPKSRRTLEVKPGLRNVLLRQREQASASGIKSEYVFTNPDGKTLSRDAMYGLFKRTLRQAGLRHRAMYQLRHTFASWSLLSGESVLWVSRAMGHRDTSLVHARYGKYIKNFLREDGAGIDETYSRHLADKNQEDGV